MEKKTRKTYKIYLVGFFIGVIGFATSFFMYISKPKPIEINYDLGDEFINDSLVFKSIDDSIYIENVIPTLDKFGVDNKGFSFTIRNNNTIDIDYELYLADYGSTIKNSDIRYQLIKNNNILGIFSLNEDGVIDKDIIKPDQEISYTIRLWLDYNSEVKTGTFNKKIALRKPLMEDVNKPILTEGMIPVYYDSNTNNWYKASQDNEDNSWYSYEDSFWANAVTVNSNKRKYYLNSEVNTKIDINDINSMWVWIPRFKYEIGTSFVSIKFVKKDEPAYQAFTFNNYELDGFWVTKFESTMKNDSRCIASSLTSICNNSNNKLYYVPNYPFANKMTMANMFYAIRKMELKGNIYGFNSNSTKLNNDGTIKDDNNNIDIHMVRNSEWQAVALLSNSNYGNKTWEVLNNNSNISGKVNIDNEEYEYNVFSKGYKASTNGNISGIYDMSGGKREYVMIENSELSIFDKKSNSGFTNKVKEYYYDNVFNENDTTLKLKSKFSTLNLIDKEPITRGGYKDTGNIFNVHSAEDYINKISLETNSRATLIIMEE